MSDAPTPAHPAPVPPAVSGRTVIIAGSILTVVFGFAVYHLRTHVIIKPYEARPGQLESLFADVSQALQAYAVDHAGHFPPEDWMAPYRRRNKNMTRSESGTVSTYRLSLLTTPTAYLTPMREGDPYSLPEQFAPLAYVNFESYAVLWSPGPNLEFDIKPWMLEVPGGRAAIEQQLTLRTYDPTNGTRSSGDLWRIVEAPPAPAK